jgi:hypothetical protein
MIEAVGQAFEIADAVIAAVHVGGDIEGIDDCVLIPKVEHCSLAGITEGGGINVRYESRFLWDLVHRSYFPHNGAARIDLGAFAG